MMNLAFEGRTTKENELKQGQKSTYCFFDLAVPRGFDKENNIITEFLPFMAFDKNAEDVSKLKKGTKIVVVADIRKRKNPKTNNYELNLIVKAIGNVRPNNKVDSAITPVEDMPICDDEDYPFQR